MKNTFTIILFLSCFIYAKSQDYAPFDMGNYWIVETYNNTNQLTQIDSMIVIKNDTINDTVRFTTINYETYNYTGILLEADTDIMMHKTVNPEMLYADLGDQIIKWIKHHPKHGESWPYIAEYNWQVEFVDTVKVFGEIYHNCYKQYVDIGDGSIFGYLLAPNIGFIKIIQEETDPVDNVIKYVKRYSVSNVTNMGFSNNSMSGAWVASFKTSDDSSTIYFRFNNSGNITDIGMFGAESITNATCNIYSNGEFYGTIPEAFRMTGSLTSDSTSSLTVFMEDTITFNSMNKVTNYNTLTGSWSGELKAGDITKQVTLTINNDGSIDDANSTGLTGEEGYMFLTETNIFGHLFTAEADSFGEIQLTGSYNNDTIQGFFDLDCGDCKKGTFLLTKVNLVNINDKKVQKQVSVFPIPANNKIYVTFTGYKKQNLSIINNLGQEIHHLNNITDDVIAIDISHYKRGVYLLVSKENQSGKINTIRFLKN